MSGNEITKKDLFAEVVEPSILEQYKESARWQSILKGVIDRLQDVDAASVEFQSLLDVKNASGFRLDFIAGLVNLKRADNESDESLLQRFHHAVQNRYAGTPDEIIYRAAFESGCKKTDVRYIEETPGTFLVYTPEGRQIPAHKVKKMAPAGVGGYPAAAIRLANGKYLVCGNRLDYILTDEEGKILTDDEGRTLFHQAIPSRRLLMVAREENVGKTRPRNSGDFNG